jgi:hypothetical protein
LELPDNFQHSLRSSAIRGPTNRLETKVTTECHQPIRISMLAGEHDDTAVPARVEKQ